MTKRQRPPIKLVQRRLGALGRKGIKIEGSKRFLRTALGDGLALFFNSNQRDIANTLRRFEKLGLSDLLDPPTETEDHGSKLVDVTARICTALGAKAASIELFDKDFSPSWSKFGKPEADAWFLTNFAFFYAKQNDPSADLDWRLSWALALGRLMEWRRYWREGHDARSRSRMGSDTGWEKVLAGGNAENKERAVMRGRWVAWARQRAQTLKSENPRITRQQLAWLIYAETELREDRAKAVGCDCGHDSEKPRLHCFICTRPTEKNIYKKI